MPNNQNLTPWKPGQSGNYKGKPKGTKHFSTTLREMLENKNFQYKQVDGTLKSGAPQDIIAGTLICRAIEGDLRAIELICRYTTPQPATAITANEADRIRFEALSEAQKSIYNL